jgi:hypothetical protein
MKRILALALLGTVAATSAFGQGHILFTNYISPYGPAQQIKGFDGQPVTPSAAVQIQVFYGLGTVADQNVLLPGLVLGISGNAYEGGGWLPAQVQVINGWSSGPVTFQLRALAGTYQGLPIDPVLSRSPLFVETSTVVPIANPPNLTPLNTKGLQLVVVPEPSTFALAGLGAAALLIFRRRQ